MTSDWILRLGLFPYTLKLEDDPLHTCCLAVHFMSHKSDDFANMECKEANKIIVRSMKYASK